MAFDVGAWERVSLGNKLMCFATVTGDGSDTTLEVPMSRIEAAYMAPTAKSGTVEAAGWSKALTWSGSTLTYSAAPTNLTQHQIFVIGTD